jgi:hypothetical protein
MSVHSSVSFTAPPESKLSKSQVFTMQKKSVQQSKNVSRLNYHQRPIKKSDTSSMLALSIYDNNGFKNTVTSKFIRKDRS